MFQISTQMDFLFSKELEVAARISTSGAATSGCMDFRNKIAMHNLCKIIKKSSFLNLPYDQHIPLKHQNKNSVDEDPLMRNQP